MDHDQLAKNKRLMAAIQQKSYSKVERALNEGAELDFVDKNNRDSTPLQLAKSIGASNIIGLLISRGARRVSTSTKQYKRHSGTQLSQSTQSTKQCKRHSGTQLPSFKPAVYNKRKGTVSLGHFYETKLLTLVLLRALQDEEIKTFYLGTNLDDAGAFDDVVLRYSKQGKDYAFFLQAKHVDQSHVNLMDMIRDPKGAFSLQKYFESYVKIRRQFKPENANVIFRGNYENIEARFLILTTTKIEFGGIATKRYLGEEKIFCSNSNLHYAIDNNQFKNLENVDRIQFRDDFIGNLRSELAKKKPILKIASCDISIATVENFFDNLVFHIKQPTEDEIDEVAVAEVARAENANTKLFKLKFLKLHEIVQTWWKQCGKVPFLTENCDFLDKVNKAVDHFSLLKNLHSVSVNRLKSYDISFSPVSLLNSEWAAKLGKWTTRLGKWASKLNEKETMYILSSCPELTALRILQYLEKNKRLQQNIIFLNEIITKQLDVEYITTAISEIQPRYLILNNRGANIEQLISGIRKHVAKLIVITDSVNAQNCLSDKSFTLCDLDDASQNRILECEIKFQGKSTPLKSLVGSQLNLVNAETLARLLAGETIEIAKPGEDTAMGYYIHRRLRRCAFKASILENEAFCIQKNSQTESLPDNERDVIVLFKSVDQQYSEETSNNVNIDFFQDYRQAEKHFEKLCAKYSTKNIHLLSASELKHADRSSEKNNVICWHKSRNDISMLRKYIDENSENEFNIRTVKDVHDEVAILAAEPGMGKSTVLTSLAAESIAEGSLSWVLRINLLNYSQQFSEWEQPDRTLEKSDVQEFLVQVSGTCSNSQSAEFSRSIFRKCYDEKNLILFVDGFDEISPNYKISVKQLLRISKESFAAKLLVATRSGGVQIELEDFLETFAYSLKPFTDEDQKLFLKKFWETKLNINN